MRPEHHQNQDTNDRFLANIQRNGTFSVVPRIAAGEITPEGLIAIGQVAKKYKLYTKVRKSSGDVCASILILGQITGGQRIDMFGAMKDDLPAIWEELNGAGFESGHAYGKSLRTVKSCVGSTCRSPYLLRSISSPTDVM
jgi:nitrite reductase (NAD(P)H)